MSATTPAQEMASCPFCGDRLRITSHTRKNDTKFWRLFCDSETDCFFMDFVTEEEAIEMANRRPARDARAAVIEECAALCDLIGHDWQNADDYIKFYAAEYLAMQIRALANRSALPKE